MIWTLIIAALMATGKLAYFFFIRQGGPASVKTPLIVLPLWLLESFSVLTHFLAFFRKVTVLGLFIFTHRIIFCIIQQQFIK